MQRKIIHIDLDYFFAQVEELYDPSLKDKPFAVGGPSNRGVLSTCNYVAREYGLHAGMPVFRAVQLCPELVLLPIDMNRYRLASQKIFSILGSITHKIESMSLDEAYIDVTGLQMFDNNAKQISQHIREVIYKDVGLTASAGVAPNKLLAKIASGVNKPNGCFVIKPHQVASFMEKLPLSKLWGVGHSTLSKLHGMGMYTCGDLQRHSLFALKKFFGKYGVALYHYCRGVDDREVVSERIEKSISVESTAMVDLHGLGECIQLMDVLYDRLLERIGNSYAHSIISGLFVKITDANFRKYSTAHKANYYGKCHFIALFRKLYAKHNSPPLRLIGLGVYVDRGGCQQIYLDLG